MYMYIRNDLKHMYTYLSNTHVPLYMYMCTVSYTHVLLMYIYFRLCQCFLNHLEIWKKEKLKQSEEETAGKVCM